MNDRPARSIRSTRAVILGAAALTALLVLAACGTGDETASSTAPTNASAPTTAPVSTTTTVPKFTGDDSTEFCLLDAHLHSTFDQAFTNAATAPIAELQAAYAGAITTVHDMVGAASPEVKPAITALETSLSRAQPYMERVHYVSSNLSAAGKAITGGPDVVAATNRLAAYEHVVCKRPN
jgi:hypothetical protein